MGCHIYQLIFHRVCLVIIPQFQRDILLWGGEVGSKSWYKLAKNLGNETSSITGYLFIEFDSCEFQ